MNTIYRLKMMLFAAILCSALALDASQSTISGVASGDSLVINQTYTVTVQAKDTFGKNLFSGGEDIYAYITDPCTRGPNMSCVPSAFNQSAVNGGEKIIKLSDLRNGKYSTDFDLNHIGDATISIILAHRQAVVGKYYNSGGISGLPDVVTSSPDINFSWAAGQDITPGNSNNVSAQFTTKLISFQSGNCTVSATQDDGADVKINGVAHVSNYGINKASSTSFDYNFNAFETYDLKIDWKNLAGPGVIKLYWQCVGDKIIIPPKNYGYAEDLGASLLQVSVVCPEKYEQTPSTTDQCRTICGDGYVISPEVCDDNNTVSGDGCSTDCTVESGHVCAGGDSENKDTCRLWSTGFYTNDSVRPTECITKCGDGQRVGSEACDDGNTIDDDGCSSDCSEIELAWKCGTSVPNICTRDYKSVPLTSIERALQIGTLVAIPILITYRQILSCLQ
ncbi:unnamed protein product [Moneuplotes crassus]|uniref:PA14 domain-containing protein n=1 Tax=Euplotes crassus TaxID=5936 RepID=A0AAD1UBV8_EUPCR|nr:unnamed protein product [Moneuplotes crassus]